METRLSRIKIPDFWKKSGTFNFIRKQQSSKNEKTQWRFRKGAINNWLEQTQADEIDSGGDW
jgi:hypothetical protein